MTPAQLLTARREQALVILQNLSAWADERVGRGFSVVHTAEGYRATLIEVERRPASGDSVTDALAQLATTVGLELEIALHEAVGS